MNAIKAHWGKALVGVLLLLCGGVYWQQSSVMASDSYQSSVEIGGMSLAQILSLVGGLLTAGTGTVVTVVKAIRGPTLAGATAEELFAELAARAWAKGAGDVLDDLAALQGKFK